MWSLGGVERLTCHAEIQERLSEVGGLNRYDAPNFRLSWAQTETFRAGGLWASDDGPSFKGYRDLLAGDGNPHWMLQEWHPPEEYGTPAAWYFQNLDPETGLQDLGEYPYQGRYETVLILAHKTLVNGELKIERIPLSWVVVECMVPIIIESRKVSMLRRKLAFIERDEQEKAERLRKIEDALTGSTPSFGAKSRSAKYLDCNSEAQKRAAAIERYWGRVTQKLSGAPKGIQQLTNRPRLIQ